MESIGQETEKDDSQPPERLDDITALVAQIAGLLSQLLELIISRAAVQSASGVVGAYEAVAELKAELHAVNTRLDALEAHGGAE